MELVPMASRASQAADTLADSAGVKIAETMQTARHEDGEQQDDFDDDEGMEEVGDAETSGPDPYAALSPRSRRKRKNRDQMRAARQRERETMDRLRSMVERLETQYQALQIKKEQQDATANGGGDAAATLDSALMTTPSASTASGVTYAELISLKSQFQEENFQLKQVLYEKGKLKQTLERYVNDVAPPTPEELRVMREDLSTDAPREPPKRPLADELFPDYVPQSADTVWRLVAEASRRVSCIQQAIHSQTSPWLNGLSHANITVISPSSTPMSSEEDGHSSSSSPPSPPLTPQPPLPPFCGWEVRHQIEANELKFEFTKSFPHIAAYGAMMRMWTNELAMNTYRDPHEAEHMHQAMRIVQHISDNAYVLQRRLVDPITQQAIISTYVRFHTRTPQGFVIGLVSIDDRGNATGRVKTERGITTPLTRESTRSFYAASACVHTEFLPMVGNAGCTVRMVGATSMETPKNAQRNVADMIMKLLRWENLNIGPFFALTDR